MGYKFVVQLPSIQSPSISYSFINQRRQINLIEGWLALLVKLIEGELVKRRLKEVKGVVFGLASLGPSSITQYSVIKNL